MKERVAAIDLLRGAAIVGMVLSGQMLWNAGLPAAMFHAQLPPPSFVFDPTVPGITWVDLVFPFFLFSMGASLPFALRRREAQGAGTRQIAGSALHRWLWLAVFAIVLANTRMGLLQDTQPWAAALSTLGIWSLFFLMFVRIPGMDRRHNTWLNRGGALLLVAATALYGPLFGVGVSFRRSDVIILILAWMALSGTLLWWLTRRKPMLRILLIAAVAVMYFASAEEDSWCAWLWRQTPAEWFFRFEYLKYLCIVLPGTIAGDMIYAHQHRAVRLRGTDTTPDKRERVCAVVFVLLLTVWIVATVWGLFVRQTALTAGLSLLLGSAAAFTLRGVAPVKRALYMRLLGTAAAWMAIGLIAEPLQGGIKKDPATVSFFFVTSALAVCVVLIALTFEQIFRLHVRPLEACGANPMFAYTASGYLLTPLITLCGLAPALQRFSESGPWAGFSRGVLLAAAVIAVTTLFTKKNYYWKS